MNEHVWVSTAKQQCDTIYFVNTDIVFKDEVKAVMALNRINDGEPVTADLCPQRIWGDKNARRYERTTNKPLPDLFNAHGYWIVSKRAADVMRRFNLGNGSLHPISEGIYQKNNKTRLPGDYFCWVFGNRKNALDVSASTNLEAPNVPWREMPVTPKDDDVAVSQDALQGPDVWIDKLLFKSIFLSGPLGDALAEAGLKETFCLYRCRVV